MTNANIGNQPAFSNNVTITLFSLGGVDGFRSGHVGEKTNVSLLSATVSTIATRLRDRAQDESNDMTAEAKKLHEWTASKILSALQSTRSRHYLRDDSADIGFERAAVIYGSHPVPMNHYLEQMNEIIDSNADLLMENLDKIFPEEYQLYNTPQVSRVASPDSAFTVVEISLLTPELKHNTSWDLGHVVLSKQFVERLESQSSSEQSDLVHAAQDVVIGAIDWEQNTRLNLLGWRTKSVEEKQLKRIELAVLGMIKKAPRIMIRRVYDFDEYPNHVVPNAKDAIMAIQERTVRTMREKLSEKVKHEVAQHVARLLNPEETTDDELMFNDLFKKDISSAIDKFDRNGPLPTIQMLLDSIGVTDSTQLLISSGR